MNPSAPATLPVVTLKIERRSSHPWIFQKMVEKPATRIGPGSVVEIHDRTGQWVGRGFYNGHSRIALRVLTTKADEPIDAEFFARKFGAVLPPDLELSGLVPPAGASLGKLRQLDLTVLSSEKGWLSIGYRLDRGDRNPRRPNGRVCGRAGRGRGDIDPDGQPGRSVGRDDGRLKHPADRVRVKSLSHHRSGHRGLRGRAETTRERRRGGRCRTRQDGINRQGRGRGRRRGRPAGRRAAEKFRPLANCSWSP